MERPNAGRNNADRSIIADDAGQFPKLLDESYPWSLLEDIYVNSYLSQHLIVGIEFEEMTDGKEGRVV